MISASAIFIVLLLLILHMSSRFTEKWRPRKVKLVQQQLSFCDTFNLNFEERFLPIEIILVFSLLIRNPEKLPKPFECI